MERVAARVSARSPLRIPRRAGRGQLQVVAVKKATKKVEVVLSKNVPELGSTGSIKKVSNGYFKNFLQPQGLAEPVTDQVMEKLKAQQDRDNAALEAKKADAQKIATALSIAKNFTIKKEANEENTYGSVTLTELKDAIKKQTTLDLADDVIDLPAIKELGVFTVTANLHPEVKQDFTVTVEKA
ncbi:plastid ribosomal protein L9 [Chloropicon roscoffensis]|uniref:Large ribosomal subunit protein bL9c n=1 Tax=Chloropicon roscoffensis TaxID=1461544 RepID=A0AAX4P8G9_9CHLO|mmetsp:Transcript_3923/g.11797  ORF Transcript_3923/g.11797 Transcript_3923/m.11797 type:complete len:184 (-) Transcript_3923:711-1262(-)